MHMARWTGRRARVLGVIAASAAAGSMQYVSGSTSTKTGTAPSRRTGAALASKV
jgi:hypothetical protein